MNLLSLEFLGFLLLVVACYYIVPKKIRWCILLIASVLFYMESGTEGIPFIIATALLSYGAALGIDYIYKTQAAYISEHEELTKEECKELQKKNRLKAKSICLGAVFLILCMLLYSKSTNVKWMKGIVAYLSGSSRNALDIIVPLGISYYTFSAISYVADVYWKRDTAERNPLKYFLFLIYFPKILQGPISRHKYLGKGLNEGHAFDFKKISFGAQLMVWGYFKKMVIADRIVFVVNEVFDNYTEYSGSILVVAVIFAALQLYCDFSGCMDMIGGASEMFGVELEKNFNHPFFSKSAAEFWRRWHITLGIWFKDYIYMPLAVSPRMLKLSQLISKGAGKRAGKIFMIVIPTSIVWLLTGLWHGTGLAYVVWGIYWGVLIILSMVLQPEIQKVTKALHIRTDVKSWQIFQMVRTFILFGIARLITVPNDLEVTWKIMQKIPAEFQVWNLVDGTLYQLGLDRPDFWVAIISFVILWAVSMLQERGSVRERIASANIVFRWMIYYAAVFAVLIFGMYGLGYDASSFIYMNY